MDLVFTLRVESTQSIEALQPGAGIHRLRMNRDGTERYDISIHDFELGRIPVFHPREFEEVAQAEPVAIDLHSRHRL